MSKKICILAVFISMLFSFQLATAADTKQLLTQPDFKYVGAFLMPASLPSGSDPAFGLGLTYRYVNGELRMFSTGSRPTSIYEVRVPAPSLNAPFPSATVIKEWGDNWWEKSYTLGGSRALQGLYWDEPDKRLYWSYGDLYPPYGGENDPSIGYSTLNDATGTITPVGTWAFIGRGPKATESCMVPIPQWFADAYTGGKRLGAGCGGYYSIITVGPDSMGPAMTAFSPPNIATNPDRSSLAFTNLVGYPETGFIPYGTERGHRDINYTGGDWWGAWNPQGDIGYWTAGDYLGQASAWIDLPDKHGLIFFPVISSGRVWYEASTLRSDHMSHWWYMYDPADLAKVAQGQIDQSHIQPVAEWQIQYPGISYPFSGINAGGVYPYPIGGVTFDSTTRRLYVAVLLAGQGSAYGVTKIYVYEVESDSTDTTPPAAPRGLRVR